MGEDPDALVDLVRTSNELQAVSLIAELEAHGISARAFNVGLMQYQMPMLQAQRVMVRRADLARAKAIVDEFEPLKGEDVNWEDVETGDEAPVRSEEQAPVRFVCARCGYSREGLRPRAVCPECGAPAAQRYELSPEEEASGGIVHYLFIAIIVGLLVLALIGYVL